MARGHRGARCLARTVVLLVAPLLSGPLRAAEPLLVEAGQIERLGALGITHAADGSLLAPGSDPAVAAGAFMTGDRLLIDGSGSPVPLRSVSFDAPTALGTSAVLTRPTPAGAAVTLVPGNSGGSLLPPGAAERTLTGQGRWTAITDSPARLLGAVPSDVDLDRVPDSADAFLTDPAASADTDGDGAPDSWNPGSGPGDSTTGLALDAFPTDPAASVDSDGDGYPDGWNPGYGPEDSTTGLTLDAFPDDPTRWALDARAIPAAAAPFLVVFAATLVVLGRRLRGRGAGPGPQLQQTA